MRKTAIHVFPCTSGLKSDVTIVFLDPDFLYDARISAICVHLLLISACILRTSSLEMGGGVLNAKWLRYARLRLGSKGTG